MMKCIEIIQASEPLEAFTKHFDDLLSKSNQCEGLCLYLKGLLLPSQRHMTLTHLA